MAARLNYRIERIALIDRVFVVRLQLVEGNHVEDGKEYEKGIDN